MLLMSSNTNTETRTNFCRQATSANTRKHVKRKAQQAGYEKNKQKKKIT